jgi:hypothetical protein
MEPCFFNVKYFFHNSGYPIVNGKIRQMYVGPHTKYVILSTFNKNWAVYIY